ncbi:hypothetical protein NQ176_g2889 [Zarea fungicola]|uniref:Uncharacterized protein n=1 Tax=Zarea fungicola TaxID=93591 RepID=A0ACC1NND1_9HYPO|nr:hypothetical protein NQ176_g2889 [Lecanicillium fungicola]
MHDVGRGTIRRAATKAAHSHFITVVRLFWRFCCTRKPSTNQCGGIASYSEQKIDRIEASLGSIERLLKRRSENKSSPHSGTSDTIASPNATVTISDVSTINTPAHIDQNEPEPDQGLNVQTDMTVALLKQAVRSTTLYGVDSKMGAALGSLYDLIGKRHINSPAGTVMAAFPMQKPVPPGGVGKLEMPPLQVAITALRRLTERSPTLLTMICSSIGLDNIEAVCSQAYDHLDNISSVEFVLVSSLEYYIFEESSMLALAPELIAEYQTHAQLCKENVDTGLANLPLLLPSTIQNVQGLLLGVCLLFLFLLHPFSCSG